MSHKFNWKSIADEILEAFSPELEKGEFRYYKPKQYIKIKEGLVFFIELNLTKSDPNIWVAVYPLCEPNLWLGSAIVAKRFPGNEGDLKTDSDEQGRLTKETLFRSLSDVFDFFNKNKTIEDLHNNMLVNDNLGSCLVRGICLAAMGDLDGAKTLLNKVYLSGVGLIGQRDGVENLLKSMALGHEGCQDFLRNSQEENIKKLRLKKYIES